jgi:hypothetical protein
MFEKLFRLLLTVTIAGAFLALLFVAWWLAVLLIVGFLVVNKVRQMLGGTKRSSVPPDDSSGARSPVIIEGSFVREDEPGDVSGDKDRR